MMFALSPLEIIYVTIVQGEQKLSISNPIPDSCEYSSIV
jgi:hypothetical protein